MQPVFVIAGREIASFFNSLIAYVVLAVFLTFNGLFFWVFEGNVLESGLAELDTLFFFTPWLFLLLVPALTMRALAEEFRQGTYQLLLSKPITPAQLLAGKFLATLALVALALVPTLIYYLTLSYLGNPPGNLDVGAIRGAYLGLLLMGAAYAAIGLWSSALSDNQIVAFLIGAFVCFFFYQGFAYVAQVPSLLGVSATIGAIGMLAHYESIARGVVDVRDVLYFFSLTAVFLALTNAALRRRHA